MIRHVSTRRKPIRSAVDRSIQAPGCQAMSSPSPNTQENQTIRVMAGPFYEFMAKRFMLSIFTNACEAADKAVWRRVSCVMAVL